MKLKKKLLEMTNMTNELSKKLEKSEKDLYFYKLQVKEKSNIHDVMEQTTTTNKCKSSI